MSNYLPIAIALDGRKCVVVGGGTVAARRIANLLECGAEVLVCAPELCTEVRDLAASGKIQWKEQPFEPDLLDRAVLVMAATNRPEVNSNVAVEARARGILCCNAQSPDDGDVIIPSTIRRGDLLISVTTCGASPFLAGRIRDEISQDYGPEYAEYVEILAAARAEVKSTVDNAEARREMLRRLAEDDSILSLVQEGRGQEARAKALSCISSSSD